MMTSLGMGIGIGYLIFVVIGVAIFGYLIWSTKRGRQEGGQGAPIAKWERAEPYWGVFVLVLLAVLLALTIWQAPWFQDQPADAQQVAVEGVQYGFLVQPASVRAGKPVTFTVTARNVNHAVGLYDKDDRLLMNVQAIPGRKITRTYTFGEPGTYVLRCLEFCGYQHHKMIYPSFQVTPS